jgi:hypothetical protein
MKQVIIISIVAVIIVILLTGCQTSKSETAYELVPSPAGLIRFDANSGKTDFLMQTPSGMRWMNVPETEVEIIFVPQPSGIQH